MIRVWLCRFLVADKKLCRTGCYFRPFSPFFTLFRLRNCPTVLHILVCSDPVSGKESSIRPPLLRAASRPIGSDSSSIQVIRHVATFHPKRKRISIFTCTKFTSHALINKTSLPKHNLQKVHFLCTKFQLKVVFSHV
jgi:hypothetical protein